LPQQERGQANQPSPGGEVGFKCPEGLTVKKAASRHFLVPQLSVAKKKKDLLATDAHRQKLDMIFLPGDLTRLKPAITWR
jgi:hypothetical protein